VEGGGGGGGWRRVEEGGGWRKEGGVWKREREDISTLKFLNIPNKVFHLWSLLSTPGEKITPAEKKYHRRL
jgi:hypothetical protein